MPAVREIYGEISLQGNASEELEKLNETANESAGSLERVDDEAKKVEGSTNEAAASAGTLTAGLAAVAAGAAILSATFISLGTDSYNAFTELQKGRVILENMAGKDFPKWSSEVNAAATASKGLRAEGDFLIISNTMQKFGLSTGFATKSMGLLQKMSDATGKDINQNIMQMSNAIASGSARFLQQNNIMAKYAEQFKKLGPGSDILIKQKREQLLLNILQKEGVNINTQYNKIMSTNFAQQQRLTTQWGNVQERLGDVITKALAPLIVHIGDFVQWLGESEEAVKLMKPAIIVMSVVIGVSLVSAFVAASVAAWAFIAPFIPLILIVAAATAAILGLVWIGYEIYKYFSTGETVIPGWAASLASAIAPLTGLAAAIGAAVFYGQELYSWFQDGESVFDDWLGPLDELIDKVKEAYNTVKPFLGIAGTAASILTGGASNAIPGIQLAGHRASGGPVSPGGIYRVNERGEEFFAPNTSGTIIPAGGLASGGARINVSVAVSVVVQNISDIKSAVKDAIDSLSENEFAAEAGLEMEPAF